MTVIDLVLLFLIGINAGVFIYMSSNPRVREELIATYGVVPSAIKNGEWYRLVSSAFLHSDVFHIFLNMYSLYALFPVTISLLALIFPGQYVLLTFFILYIVSAITAGLVSASRNSYVPSIGASGAVFGMLGFLLTVGLALMTPLFGIPGISGVGLVQSILFVLVINFAIGLFPGLNIDNRGHFGGLAGGVLFAVVALLFTLF